MSIAIDSKRCIGCKRCTVVCPGTLIEMNEFGKAHMAYPRDCWGCVSCVKECPVQAISFYLGADMGGQGGMMTVEEKGHFLYWHIRTGDGRHETITINRQESNQY
ncbi:ferredoxin family protein [uncultured Veillonella sp.]|uniref:4Fe-4S dicluster domain-containing protein n=1 Tax=uncultured Veillonella sp. TaxID=159268 RepID=UPI0025E66497|nr:ferredoxin family protein [uncultured Veillonella sp.]